MRILAMHSKVAYVTDTDETFTGFDEMEEDDDNF